MIPHLSWDKLLNVLYLVLKLTSSLFYLPYSQAVLPLAVEDLIVDKGHFKSELSFYYANFDKQHVTTGDFVMIQTGESSFILVPSRVAEGSVNSDVLVGSVGLRYGVTNRMEIYTRSSWLYSELRAIGINQREKMHQSRFTDAWLGMNYQLRDENTFGIIGFFEFALVEKQFTSLHHLKSYLMGVTSYSTLDPMVFAMTVAYRLNRKRVKQITPYKPGNYWLLHPSVSFAANDKVTLSMGLRWLNTQASQRDNFSNGLRKTSSDMILGVGYGSNSNNTFNVTLTANHSGRNGADLRVAWLHRF